MTRNTVSFCGSQSLQATRFVARGKYTDSTPGLRGLLPRGLSLKNELVMMLLSDDGHTSDASAACLVSELYDEEFANVSGSDQRIGKRPAHRNKLIALGRGPTCGDFCGNVAVMQKESKLDFVGLADEPESLVLHGKETSDGGAYWPTASKGRVDIETRSETSESTIHPLACAADIQQDSRGTIGRASRMDF